MRKIFTVVTHWLIGVWRGSDHHSLATFSGDMRLSLGAGLGIAESFERCRLGLDNRKLATLWRPTFDRLMEGNNLVDSLRSGESMLPPYYLPAIEAGERSGKLVEVFSFLEVHCRLMQPLTKTLRQLWLYPLVLILAGSTVRFFLSLLGGDFGGGMTILYDTVTGLLLTVSMIALLWLTPIRMVFDELRLQLPWVGLIERQLAANRYFCILSLLESAQCDQVDEMIRVASRTVSNQAIVAQLQAVQRSILNGSTIGEAYAGAGFLELEEQQTILAADLSGTLHGAYSYLAEQSEQRLHPRLKLLQEITAKLVSLLVLYCILIELFRMAF
ncbi:type II secretion system F family protein [bacterium]|jgi:general secretion pathway protein F|nr:type II secretion system F family protein [bacterium]